MKTNNAVALTDIYGIWKRDYLKSPDHFDDTTVVHWFQSDCLHVDIRIPKGFGVAGELAGLTSCSQLTDDQLRALLTAEGFAGTTEVDNSVCTWSRLINYRGKLQGLDTGLLEQMPEGLVETGIHDEYSELWQLDYPTINAAKGREIPTGHMMQSADGAQCMIIVYTSSRFALGRGRPADLNHPTELAGRLEIAIADKSQADLAALFGMEFCAGTIDDRGGVIEISTHPFRSGAVLFESGAIDSIDQGISITCVDFYGNESPMLFRML